MHLRATEFDPFYGITTKYWSEGSGIVVQTTQDVTPIIERNKVLHNTDYARQGIKKSWMHAATITDAMWTECIALGMDPCSAEGTKYIVGLLNDPDNKYLKTGNVKL